VDKRQRNLLITWSLLLLVFLPLVSLLFARLFGPR